MCALTVALMSLGTAAELVGLYLVAREFGAAIRQAQRIAPQPFEQARPLKVSQGRRPLPAAQGTNLDDRVQRLEAVTSELEDVIYQRTGDLNDRIANVALAVADSALDVHTREKAIREFLRDMLTADLGRRRLGVGLLAVGIALALAGNLAGLAAC